MLDKLKNMFEAQKKMKDIQKKLEDMSIEHKTASGKIKLRMNGAQRVVSIDIDEDFLIPGMKTRLETELCDCLNSASEKVQKLAAEEFKTAMGDLKLPGL